MEAHVIGLRGEEHEVRRGVVEAVPVAVMDDGTGWQRAELAGHLESGEALAVTILAVVVLLDAGLITRVRAVGVNPPFHVTRFFGDGRPAPRALNLDGGLIDPSARAPTCEIGADGGLTHAELGGDRDLRPAGVVEGHSFEGQAWPHGVHILACARTGF